MTVWDGPVLGQELDLIMPGVGLDNPWGVSSNSAYYLILDFGLTAPKPDPAQRAGVVVWGEIHVWCPSGLFVGTGSI